MRWNLIKSGFSRGLSSAAGRSPSKIGKREKGIWQRHYWEHVIRDDADLARHIDYIHFNPVKHGLVRAYAIGLTAASINMWRAARCRRTGMATVDDVRGSFGER